MEQLTELEIAAFQLSMGFAQADRCVDWAVQRLGLGQEGDDLEIVLLASARGAGEVLPLAEAIIERYRGAGRLNAQFLAGKYIAELRDAYLAGRESVQSLDAILTRLYPALGYPDWLVMLSRNCEYATDVQNFEQPFEEEFHYIASLWAQAESLAAFARAYRRETSDRHDATGT
ncbi:hypothetical protein [Janthinobacterium sp. 1_2014MBL_MicDiv]|uniref:hypothetical protein n=1 Tax=Janthinobacterium sp. 1_2014MBL_MicDiv TaxID=1644131 RepID=UPI0008F4C54B|nr:hypothetical protein [Janthinobacterium sp. 1_2014MBL_MicDiv]APA68630.1 hypothetical protein YQ44_13375 [Janthinobacterium sp. 1_2014MBL_MicDiv]